MKIIDLKTYKLRYQLSECEAFASSQAWFNTRSAMIVRIFTDSNIEGVGEASGPIELTSGVIEHIFKPLLIGSDPFDVEVIWEKLYNTLRDHGQKGIVIDGISAIDIALWDIMGKATGLPVHKLLGGCYRDKVTAYATGLYHRKVENQTQCLVKEAVGYVQEGFKAVKLKIGFGLEEDVQNVRAVRKAIGDNIKLLLDANRAYNTCNAIQLGRKIEKYDIFWLEEPLPPEDVDGYVEIKTKLNIPIAAGESEFTRFGFRTLLFRRAVDFIQVNLCAAGGLSEAKKIADLASIANIQCVPQVWGSAVAVAAGLQFMATLPDYPASLNPTPALFELDRSPNIFREQLATRSLKLNHGTLEIPKEPGLGVELSEEILEKYKVRDEV